MMVADIKRARAVNAGPRVMGIRSALEWAFGPENARMDFDHTGSHEFDRVGRSPEWQLMERAKLGCRVDGGGATASVHPDAALIAAAVEALELNPVFGRKMAITVATHARSCTAPDWRSAERRAVVPQGWDITRAGEATAYEVKGPEWTYKTKCRHIAKVRPTLCPINYTGGAAAIARARREYLDWYGALCDLSSTLLMWGCLDTVEISSTMPPLTPWKNNC